MHLKEYNRPTSDIRIKFELKVQLLNFCAHTSFVSDSAVASQLLNYKPYPLTEEELICAQRKSKKKVIHQYPRKGRRLRESSSRSISLSKLWRTISQSKS